MSLEMLLFLYILGFIGVLILIGLGIYIDAWIWNKREEASRERRRKRTEKKDY